MSGTLVSRRFDGWVNAYVDLAAAVSPGSFQMQWRSYRRSFRDRELWGGNATPFFRSYVEELPTARTAEEKVVLIDRVVHAAHVALRPGTVTRRAVSNLIEGTSAGVLRLLDELA